jgi:hypothetical protein
MQNGPLYSLSRIYQSPQLPLLSLHTITGRQAFPGISRQHLKKIHLASFHQTSDFPDFLFHATRIRKENHPFCTCCMWLSEHDDFGNLSSTLVFLLSVWQVETLPLAKGIEPFPTASFRFFPYSCVQNLIN